MHPWHNLSMPLWLLVGLLFPHPLAQWSSHPWNKSARKSMCFEGEMSGWQVEHTLSSTLPYSLTTPSHTLKSFSPILFPNPLGLRIFSTRFCLPENTATVGNCGCSKCPAHPPLASMWSSCRFVFCFCFWSFDWLFLVTVFTSNRWTDASNACLCSLISSPYHRINWIKSCSSARPAKQAFALFAANCIHNALVRFWVIVVIIIIIIVVVVIIVIVIVIICDYSLTWIYSISLSPLSHLFFQTSWFAKLLWSVQSVGCYSCVSAMRSGWLLPRTRHFMRVALRLGCARRYRQSKARLIWSTR